MEKEMKKLLLVAVSVGIFLLVTITVAIIILTPKTQESTISSSVPYSNQGTTALNNMTNLPPEPAVISRPQEQIAKPEVVEITATPIETDTNNGDSLTIQIPQPTTAAVPDNKTAAPSAPAEPAVVQVKPAASASKPTVVEKPAAAAKPAASASKPTVAEKPAASVKPTSARAISDYWVQTGAFSSMVRAEDAKEMLFDKGLTSIIETSIINGQNFFRVRLGPYTSENEAKHWLAIVQLIDGFHDSQVRQTVR